VAAFDPDIADGYENLAGVGLLPFTILPHVNRWEERLPDLKDKLDAFAADTGLQVKTIRDGDAVFVHPDGTLTEYSSQSSACLPENTL
jgi:hypothetical protein